MKNTRTRFIVIAALVAAFYALLTYLSLAFNLAYGPVQFRLSEALTLLPVVSGAAVPGLAVGWATSPVPTGWSTLSAAPALRCWRRSARACLPACGCAGFPSCRC